MTTLPAQLLLLLGCTALVCDARREPSRPVWADKYKVSFNFTVPYVSTLQSGGLTYRYEVLQDYRNAKQRVVRDGVETVTIRVDDDIMYQVFPASDKMRCWKGSVGSGSGPTRRRLSMAVAAEAALSSATPSFSSGDTKPQDYLTFVLPDLSEERWRYNGQQRYGEAGAKADVWEWDLSEGGMPMQYSFNTDAGGRPLRLHILGINLYTGGHRDEYVAHFFDYAPLDGIADEEFQAPKGIDCEDADPDAAASEAAFSHRQQGHPGGPAAFLRRLMPNQHWGDAGYDAFAHRHGRRHRHAAEYAARRSEFHANSKFVAEWNEAAAAAAGSGAASGNKAGSGGHQRRHRLGLNRLADWSREEYLALLGRRPRSRAPSLSRGNATAVPPGDPMLPAELIWKGTPADSPVKDQAACGSCWAFSAVAALEAALYRTTGRQQLLSEQNLVDCAWGAANSGCYGGEQSRALEWVLRRGGLAPLEGYQYRGVNDFCQKGAAKVALKGRVVEVGGGEAGLQAALLSKGPMAVSVDADSDEFRFYMGGVYSNPDCATAAGDLSHAVIVSGYGTAEDGTPYWLVKNMWSPNWGEDGYIRIARKGNDCGIATDPMYVQLDGE